MKTYHPKFAAGTFAVVALAMGAPASALTITSFDDAGSLSGWRLESYGLQTANIAFEPGQDADGSPSSGSLRLTLPFVAAEGGNNRFAFTYDAFSSPGMDFSDPSFTEISFNVKVDATSVQDAFGQYGYQDFVIRNTDNYDYNSQFGGNIAGNNEWQSFSASLTVGRNAVRAFTYQIYGGPGQNIDGTVILYIDNIVVSQIPEPSTFGAASALGALAFAALRRRRSRVS